MGGRTDKAAKKFVILPTGPNSYVADGISLCLGKEPMHIASADFTDGHFIRRILDTVRRRPVYLVQTYEAGRPYPMFAEMGQMLNASLRASAARRTVVMPKLVGDRQDRMNQAGEPLEAQFVVEALEAWGMNSLIAVRSHFAQYDSVVRVPALLLSGLPLFAYHLRQHVTNPDDLCFVAADGGAEKETQLFMELMGSTHYATVLQYRDVTDKSSTLKKVRGVSGVEHIRGRQCVLIEDIVESGKTAANAGAAVKEAGAAGVHLYVAHLGLSSDALHHLNAAPFDSIIGLDTIYHQPYFLAQFEKLQVLSCIPMLADVISRDAQGDSTRLFACLDRSTLSAEPNRLFDLVKEVYTKAKDLPYQRTNPDHMMLRERVNALFNNPPS